MDPEKKKDDKILGGTTAVDSYVKDDAAKKLEEGLMTAEDKEMKALTDAQQQQLRGEMGAADAKISSVADLLSVAEKERAAKRANDAQAQKRENALRYIAGIGDSISGVANLVGVAQLGASNQQQTYNAPGLMSKIDASRAQRTQKMEDLNKKIDELRQRETDLKSAKSLREAQLNAAHAKEQLALKQQQEATAREEAWKKREHELKVKDAETRRISAMASDTRAEAYANKPAKQYKPGEEYSFDLIGGETVSIPGHLWNDAALTSVYAIVPDEMKTKRPKMTKNAAGIDEIAKDAEGNIIYVTPSKQEMLNDIVAAAATNQAVADALKKRAKGTGANDSRWR